MDRFWLRVLLFVAQRAAACKDAGACETQATGGKMNRNQRRPRHGGRYDCESVYSVDLARGASHIASMLSAATQEAAVHEVMHAFVATYGAADFDVFCWLPAERLERRGCANGATQARDFDLSGLARELAGARCAG